MPEGGLLPVVLGAIPPLAGLLGKLYLAGSDSRVTRKIAKDSELYNVVPDSSKKALEDLIDKEVQEHVQRRSRKLEWSTVAAVIFVATVTAGVGYALAWAALEYSWLLWFVFAPVTLLGFLLILTGLIGNLFIYPDADGNYPTRQPRDESSQ